MRAALLLLLASGCSGESGGNDLSASCTSSSQCGTPGLAPEHCLAPSEYGGCGACAPSIPCSTDNDCAGDAGVGSPESPGGHICDVPELYFLCNCNRGEACTAGCSSDSECAGGRICNSSHHCIWKSCVTDGDCPGTFACSTGQCRRRTCQTSADCPAGVCVDNACYDTYGVCKRDPV
jgi:hypothetical protein